VNLDDARKIHEYNPQHVRVENFRPATAVFSAFIPPPRADYQLVTAFYVDRDAQLCVSTTAAASYSIVVDGVMAFSHLSNH